MAEVNATKISLSTLHPPEGAVKRKMRVGRGPGSGKGKTSGHGVKGQKARTTGSFSKLHFEGGQLPLQRRLPKFGFHNIFSKRVAAINVRDLERFDAGTEITIETLRQAGLVRNKDQHLKILGQGSLSKALNVSAYGFSASAKQKIEAAGGKVVVLSTDPKEPTEAEDKSKDKADKS